jgi:predicted PurR-regulated permease PerM
MTEKVSEKKVIGRNVAIALGIICIILAVGLVGAIAVYTPMINDKNNTIDSLNSEVTSRDNTIASLNSQIITKNNTISSLNSQIASEDNTIASDNLQISSLNSQVSSLTDTVNLANSMTWVNDQTVSQSVSSYTYWTVSASYAGYVSVDVLSSTTTKTYVEVIWYAYGVSYDSGQISVGVSGTAVFPILPCSSIEIIVGNTNISNGATETVTITYYY